MTYREILSRVDHTLLKQGATWEQIKAVCDDGLRFGTASVCIPPSFVKQAAEYLKGRLPVCTVIGFPNGYNTTAVKVYETAEAVENGADEIDMVVNLGWVKEGRYDRVLEEINAVKKACAGRLLKVIIKLNIMIDALKGSVSQIREHNRLTLLLCHLPLNSLILEIRMIKRYIETREIWII